MHKIDFDLLMRWHALKMKAIQSSEHYCVVHQREKGLRDVFPSAKRLIVYRLVEFCNTDACEVLSEGSRLWRPHSDSKGTLR